MTLKINPFSCELPSDNAEDQMIQQNSIISHFVVLKNRDLDEGIGAGTFEREARKSKSSKWIFCEALAWRVDRRFLTLSLG
ncbi:MAG: hypothetical protein ONB31_09900 [candidate division KSB1 bacterium]|nr:hypothetical protein [candidate division KSB1 bacterium]MDZ7336064.1 hypothetical protein [candidate division KSB1 bacterium]MDZ7358048.1 hypothetical protein [candidate division KSB1 bacterium]MDZ7402249.1 hypothetical protein [candidate division KSB1 bacterium]